jgi:hypothetical protein
MGTDPSGNFSLLSVSATVGTLVSLTTIGVITNAYFFGEAVAKDADSKPDAAILSLGLGGRAFGLGGGGVADVIYFFDTDKAYLYGGGAIGLEPISYLGSRRGLTTNLAAGLLFNINSPGDWAGHGFFATFPLRFSRILARAYAGKNGAYGALLQLAKKESLGGFSNISFQFANSTSGAAAIRVGAKSSTFATDYSYLSDPVELGDLAARTGQFFGSLAQQIRSTARTISSDFGNALDLIK